MIKFNSDLDLKLFLCEVGEFEEISKLTDDYKPSDELVEKFLKKRKKLINNLKDFRKSQNQKQNWRRKKTSIMRGIKKFHRSTEGKRFHRSLDRFNSVREHLSAETHLVENLEFLKGISSLKTHLLIEAHYFRDVEGELDFHAFFEEVIPFLDTLSSRILQNNFNLNLEEQELLSYLVDRSKVDEELNKEETEES